jgi:hypothetical protein
MKIVHKISVFILLLIITFSSVGISFYLHQCGCRETTLFSFETGYSAPDEFCCCSVQTPAAGESSCCDEVEKEECCKDQYYFILLPLGPEPIASNTKTYDVKILSSLNTALVSPDEFSNPTEPVTRLHSPPVVMGGKMLIYFTHQIKIPFPIA